MFVETRRPETNTPAGWAQTLRPDSLSHLKKRVDGRWRLIRRFLKEPVLDAGCGRGDWVSFLNDHDHRAAGLDYSPDMIKANRATYPRCRFEEGRIQDMPFRDGEFSAIISWGVIEHDPDGPGAALHEFRRVLRPGGRILVTVPVDSTQQRYATQAQMAAKPSLRGDTFFQYLFTIEELAMHCVKAGFTVLETGYDRPRPALRFPHACAEAGNLKFRALQALSLFAGSSYSNMIYCVASR